MTRSTVIPSSAKKATVSATNWAHVEPFSSGSARTNAMRLWSSMATCR